MGFVSNPPATTSASSSVVVNDNTVKNITETSATAQKTYTGLTFGTKTVFRISIWIKAKTGTDTTIIGVQIGDGTNVTTVASRTTGSMAINTFAFYEFIISQQDSATTTVCLSRDSEIDNTINNPLQANTATTITASGTWAGQDRIIILGQVTASDNTDIERVVIEQLGDVA